MLTKVISRKTDPESSATENIPYFAHILLTCFPCTGFLHMTTAPDVNDQRPVHISGWVLKSNRKTSDLSAGFWDFWSVRGGNKVYAQTLCKDIRPVQYRQNPKSSSPKRSPTAVMLLRYEGKATVGKIKHTPAITGFW